MSVRRTSLNPGAPLPPGSAWCGHDEVWRYVGSLNVRIVTLSAHCSPLCTVLATDDLLPFNEGQIISIKISGDISVRHTGHTLIVTQYTEKYLQT